MATSRSALARITEISRLLVGNTPIKTMSEFSAELNSDYLIQTNKKAFSFVLTYEEVSTFLGES